MPWVIICEKFCKDALTYKRVFDTGIWGTSSRIYRRIDGQTNGHGEINSAPHADNLYIPYIFNGVFELSLWILNLICSVRDIRRMNCGLFQRNHVVHPDLSLPIRFDLWNDFFA